MRSFLFLWIQVFIPGFSFYFLTSNDFAFAFHLQKWIIMVICLGLIFFTIIMTIITYWFRLHELDQFTYSVPFAFALSALILSSYFFENNNSSWVFFRFIIVFLVALLGTVLTSIMLLVIFKNKSKQNGNK